MNNPGEVCWEVVIFAEKTVEYLAQHIESLIFASDTSISLKEIKDCLEASFEIELPESDLLAAIAALHERYASDAFAFQIEEVSGGYQFMTKPAYHQTVGAYLRQTTNKRLSRSALETLAIIAYKQPVTKPEVEKIRGVNCDYAVQKLLEKELVSIVGRSEGPYRPLLYGTSDRFMDYFGLKSLKDLPTPKDFKAPENAIGEQAPIEEDAADQVEPTQEGKTDED